MKTIGTSLEGVYIIEPRIYNDERGFVFEYFNQSEFDSRISCVNFVQDNESYSKYGVIRALHFQKPPYAQCKLVRCVEGEILDVAVDVRKGSPTFGCWTGVKLNEKNHRMLFSPKGFAHGFSVLSNDATVLFKCDNYFHPEAEIAMAWNDPQIGVNWEIDEKHVIVSQKDLNQPLLENINYLFD